MDLHEGFAGDRLESRYCLVYVTEALHVDESLKTTESGKEPTIKAWGTPAFEDGGETMKHQRIPRISQQRHE